MCNWLYKEKNDDMKYVVMTVMYIICWTFISPLMFADMIAETVAAFAESQGDENGFDGAAIFK